MLSPTPGETGYLQRRCAAILHGCRCPNSKQRNASLGTSVGISPEDCFSTRKESYFYYITAVGELPTRRSRVLSLSWGHRFLLCSEVPFNTS